MKNIAIYGGDSYAERLWFSIFLRDSIHNMKFMDIIDLIRRDDEFVLDVGCNGAAILYDLDEISVLDIDCISFEQKIPVIIMIPRELSFVLESKSFNRRFLIINLDKYEN